MNYAQQLQEMIIMANYANQKTITLGHLNDIKHEKGIEEAFLQPTKWAPLKEAMRLLNGNAFKLYIYLLSWEGQGYYDFSPANIAKEIRISDEGARNARTELIRLGFIVEENNKLVFYPISRTIVS